MKPWCFGNEWCITDKEAKGSTERAVFRNLYQVIPRYRGFVPCFRGFMEPWLGVWLKGLTIRDKPQRGRHSETKLDPKRSKSKTDSRRDSIALSASCTC